MTPNDLHAAGYRAAKGLVHRMIDDLTPEDYRHQPVPGANSALWVIGHLAVILRRSAERLGATDLPAVDPAMAARFMPTKQLAGTQNELGDPAEWVRLFDICVDKVAEVVKAVPAANLDAPPLFPVPFATNQGEATLFGALHVAMHVGQLSTIRRSLGKPPVV
jgi:hypothetical protein